MWLLLMLLFLIRPQFSYAVGEFRIDQTITYDLADNGTARVNQEISLTNNLSQIYPKQYQVELSESSVTDIRAHDDSGNIIQNIDNGNSQTSILLNFNHPSMGKNQVTKFYLNYNLPDFITAKGKTRELVLPDYHLDNPDLSNFDITINIPQSFGKMSFSSLPSITPDYQINTTLIHLTKNQIIGHQVLFIFGDYQIFDFNLSYYLHNDSSNTINTEIAIPPDTGYQKMTYRSLSPQPLNVTQDTDGNWLAQYQLLPQQSKTITASGQAKLFLPKNQIEKINSVNYLQSQPFWPTTNSQIALLAQRYKTPQQIYDYVVATLSYDFDLSHSTGRQGALNALTTPQYSLCTEFTDLFVTIARANGIPAREIEGFAYTNNPKIKPTNTNTDILHAWPQYYNLANQHWVSVDPTWGKTTNGVDYFTELDLNHFTFVIHGLQSNYPSPPGSYKSDPQVKTVDVGYANQETFPNIQPLIFNLHSFGLLNPQLQLDIHNPNLVSINNLSISFLNSTQTVSSLPPLSFQTITLPPLSFLASLTPQNRHFTLNFSSDEISPPGSLTLDNPNFYLYLTVAIAITIVILCILGIILTISNTHSTHEKNL